MSNRRKPRRARPVLTFSTQPPSTDPTDHACPDCDSTVRFTGAGPGKPGLTHVHVEHDQSCPWLAEQERQGRV